MEVRVLGPVDARDAGADLPLGGTRPRTVVAVLALAGGPMSVGRIVEEVWRSDPPRSAVATLQSYLSRLRTTLGAQRVTNGRGTYELVLAPDELDVARFERDLEHARTAAHEGATDRAAESYLAALGAWRGEVADGLDHGPLLREVAARLGEQRLIALEEWIDVELLAGRHREIVPDLEALTGANPHRERLHAQQMVALYRAGRQADALLAYHAARRRFVDGLGIEPGPALQLLQQRILAQDPQLELTGTQRDGASDPAMASGPDGSGTARSGDASGPRRHARVGNLPTPLDSFIGRVSERARIADLLGDGRLISLVGAGGCGKTQLALRVASDVSARFEGHVWWVELGSHREDASVLRAVGAALGIPERREAGSQLDGIVARLEGDPGLLVLDNCEHLVEPCAELVSELLGSCAGLRVLATSREPLDVAGERAWRVPSLGVPPVGATSAEVLEYESVQLLLTRAAVARPGFELGDLDEADVDTLGRICRELDGIPLAIELAAARLGVLSVVELADRLGDRFRVLTGGRRSAPARHRTLEAAIAWSYELLTGDERRLVTSLAVFAGGFTLEDVEEVCAGDDLPVGAILDLLEALVAKSLVQRLPSASGPARHDLLATVRSFMAARLDADLGERLRARHADHYATLAERARPELIGPEQVAWLNRLHAEQDNLRQALARGGEPAARIAASVWLFWLEFGHADEGHGWLTQLLSRPQTDDAAVLLRLREGAARLAAAVGDTAAIARHLEVIERYAADLGDRSATIRCTALLATTAAEVGDRPRALEAVDEARRLVDDATGPWTRAVLEHHAASVALWSGDLGRAAAAYHAAGVDYEAAGDQWGACLARIGAARVARRSGDGALAVRLHRTNLARGLDLTVSSLDFVGLPVDLQGLALSSSDAGRLDLAVWLLGAASALHTAVEVREPPEDRADRQHVWERAVDTLGAAAASAAHDDGRSHTAEAAVQLALERTAELT